MSSPLPEPISEALADGHPKYSESTLRVYRTAWRDFLDYLGGFDRQTDRLPPPEAVAEYLDARRDLAWSTLMSRRQAIREVYDALDEKDPYDDPAVQEVWTEIRERKREEPDRVQKRSLEEREHSFAEIIEKGPSLLNRHLGGGASQTEEENLRYLPETVPHSEDLSPDQRDLIPDPTYDLQVLRNRALLLLVGTADSTRAELVGIDLEDIYPPDEEDGATRVLLYNRMGEPGRILRLESAPEMEYCPHRALAAWILAADLMEGALFRSFTPHGEVSQNRIRPQTINHVINRCAKKANLDPDDWSTRRLKGP